MFGRDLPEAWLDYADRSYVSTRLLWFSGFTLDTPVYAHRTIELYLKAYLVAQGKMIQPGSVWGHDLEELRSRCEALDSSFCAPEFTRRIGYFQRYFDLVRYPCDLEGELTDGSGIWFAWDANILPLDQMVAFLRPRIPFCGWEATWLHQISLDSDHSKPQPGALRDANSHLDQILCMETHQSVVEFDEAFTYDLPGC